VHRKNDFLAVTEKQKKRLPDDWREMLSTIPGKVPLIEIQQCFNVSHSCLVRLRKDHPDFDKAVLAKMKHANNSRKPPPKQERKIIDAREIIRDLRMLRESTTKRHERRALDDALRLIETLRAELLSARSEMRIALERLHFRATGTAPRAHATNGSQSLQGIDAAPVE
jgi:hypothetical protein